MGSVINTNVAANSIHGIYTNNNNRMNAAMTRVATAQKINSAKDGGSIWSISEKMRERIRSNDQANQNVQNDTALLKTAEGGIGNTIDIIKTLKERAISAADDTNDDSSRAVIANEVKQLLNGINDNASKVKFNGRTLLDGTLGTTSSASKITSEYVAEPKAATEGTVIQSAATYFLSASNGGSLRALSGGATAAVASNTLLVNLVDTNKNSLVNVGDKITFSWTEDGKENSYSFTVGSDTKFADVDFSKGALKVSYLAAGAAIKDSDGNNIISGGDDAGAGNKVGTYASTTTSTGLGLWAVGKEGVNIGDFKVSVTYEENGTEKSRVINKDATPKTYTQDAFKFEGKSQVAEGSQEVNVLTVTGTAAVATDTKLMDLLSGSTNSETDVISLSVGDKAYTFQGSDTIQKVIDKLADEGIAVQLGNGDPLKNADGEIVTLTNDKGTSQFKTATGDASAKKGNLYFTGADGSTIGDITLKAYSQTAYNSGLDPDKTFAGNNTNGTVTATSGLKSWQAQQLPSEKVDEGAVKGLTFFVGGEQGFAMQNVDIANMKAEALFGDSIENISNLFKTGKGAQEAIGLIDTALQTALDAQTDVGALEMRLGYIGDNLTTMNENLQAADSTFRDADMAKEMTAYMKYAVLSQASQYMLAQASQNAYQVLNLLQA